MMRRYGVTSLTAAEQPLGRSRNWNIVCFVSVATKDKRAGRVSDKVQESPGAGQRSDITHCLFTHQDIYVTVNTLMLNQSVKYLQYFTNNLVYFFQLKINS